MTKQMGVQTGSDISASSGNVAAAIATATLTPPAGRTVCIAGFSVHGAGATAASVVNVTVTGAIGGTMTFPLAVVAGATLGNAPMWVQFNPALSATGPGVSIAVSCPSLGAGNTNNAVNAWGFVV